MSHKKTLIEWQTKSDEIHNSEFEILQEPKNSHDIIDVLHKKCGNLFKTSMNNHSKRYCKYCSNKNSKTLVEWQTKSDEIHNSEFEILQEPVNVRKKVEVFHKKCGTVLSLTMNNHINHKNGCKKCAKNSLKSNEYWLKKCEDIWENEYSILEEIQTVWHKVKIKHELCGNIILKDMNNLIHNKRGCSICSKKEYGKEYVQKYLDSQKIIYETEKKFEGLINPLTNRKLRIDLFIPSMKTAIEVHGLQHYKPIKHWGGEKGYKTQIERDKIKEIFLYNEGIRLIIINNKEVKNIKNILWQL